MIPYENLLAGIGFLFLARMMGFFSTKKPPKNWKVTSLSHPRKIAFFEIEGYLVGLNKNGVNARGNPAFCFSTFPSLLQSLFVVAELKKDGEKFQAAAAITPCHPFFTRQFHCANIPSEFSQKGMKFKKIWIKGFVIHESKWLNAYPTIEFDKFADDLRTEGQGGNEKFSSSCPVIEILEAGYVNKITLGTRIRYGIDRFLLKWRTA